MSKIDFENMLNKHNNERLKQLEETNWETHKNEWLGFIKQFYDSIEPWLKPYSKKGLSYTFEEITLNEEYIGSYEVNIMMINFAGQHVKLMPIGTRLIGTKGRIDMEGTRGRVQFVLADKDNKGVKTTSFIHIEGEPPDWTWKIVLREQRKITFDDFTEENFFNALMEVSNG
jgi:hypothetical protein